MSPRSAAARLPQPLTTLVGRERPLAEARALLDDRNVHLLTLTGPGGVGKTRLALRLAAEAAGDFAEGALFVDLAPVVDPTLVPAAIAQAVGLPPAEDRPVAERLKEHLQDRNLLLVLDNMEHLLETGLFVASLLAHCPDLVVLSTSRVRLGLYGEQTFEVPPLTLPDNAAPSVEAVAGSEAVRLFVERARAARPGFALTEENAADVAALCRRLDGLPLAIELAAARLAHLPVKAILTRLDRSLALLTVGRRDQPARHQTMRAAIAWSYDLLPADVQALCRRLAVFAGGWTLDAAEAVCGGQEAGGRGQGEGGLSSPTPASRLLPPALDGLADLVDASLVRQTEDSDGESRYTMQEMIREFGVEQLAACGEEAEARWAHAAYFLAFAERIKPELRGPEPGVWLDRLEADHDNLRAALRWSLDHETGGAETALRICTALYLFWKQRGHIPEARRWLEMALERSGDVVSLSRANGFLLLGHSTWDQAEAWRHYEQSLEIYRQLGNSRYTAGALTSLGKVAADTGEHDRARALLVESQTIFTDLEDEAGMAQSEFQLGYSASMQGEYRRAKEEFDRARGRWERLGDVGSVVNTLFELGRLHRLQGQFIEAENLLTWGLQRSQSARIQDATAAILQELGVVAIERGEPFVAVQHIQGALFLISDLGIVHEIAIAALEAMARVALSQGRADFAVRLWGAASAWRDRSGTTPTSTEREARERACLTATKALGTPGFEVEWSIGQSMSPAEAMELACSTEVVPSKRDQGAHVQPKTFDHGLTARELDVLCLTVEGLTDQQIADSLFISRRTATTHAVNIRNKLDVDNRAAAAAFAVRHHLCDVRFSEW